MLTGDAGKGAFFIAIGVAAPIDKRKTSRLSMVLDWGQPRPAPVRYRLPNGSAFTNTLFAGVTPR